MMLALVTMYHARAVLSPLDESGNAMQVTMFLPSYLPPKRLRVETPVIVKRGIL